MTMFYSQPYDLTAIGFYFKDEDAFHAKMKNAHNSNGQPVQEFEIQFIDGETIDAALCEAIGLHQGNVGKVLESTDTLHERNHFVNCLMARETDSSNFSFSIK